MIGIALGMAAVGVLLSAFFSGSETGFYRATRMRLVLDAVAGDPVARFLHWLTNHPTLFIATTLVGNNLANYLVSLAIVIATDSLSSAESQAAEIIAPLLLAPLLFVYGELVPKNFFLHAPNRLLRLGGPLFLVFVPLFFPISAILWGLNRLLARLIQEPPEMVQLRLARRELERLLEEGHEAGLLHPAQRGLAQATFQLAGRPVSAYTTPLADMPRARADMSREEILQVARRCRLAAVPVESVDGQRQLIGYVRVVDLRLYSSNPASLLRPLLAIDQAETYLGALTSMHSAKEMLAQVVDAAGRAVGILTVQHLREPLFHRGRAAK
jgi:CBS domain containing-hemolysin-like protein